MMLELIQKLIENNRFEDIPFIKKIRSIVKSFIKNMELYHNKFLVGTDLIDNLPGIE